MAGVVGTGEGRRVPGAGCRVPGIGPLVGCGGGVPEPCGMGSMRKLDIPWYLSSKMGCEDAGFFIDVTPSPNSID